MFTTQKQIRAAFWADNIEHDAVARKRGTRSKSQNSQSTDCRVAFCDYVDCLQKTGQISYELAERVTL